MILAVISTVFGSTVFGFFCFHCWLTAKNLTSIELAIKKGARSNVENPFDLGFRENINQVLCVLTIN